MSEEEEIVVKPSTDKIPDEYIIQKDNKVQVHTFSFSSSEAKNKVKCFEETLPLDYYIFFHHSLESDNFNDLLNNSKYLLVIHRFHPQQKRFKALNCLYFVFIIIFLFH